MERSLLLLLVFPLASAFLCSGCATLFTRSTVTVQMDSQPPGARYDVRPFLGKTPDSIAIPKKSIPDFATFELPGTRDRRFLSNRESQEPSGVVSTGSANHAHADSGEQRSRS